MNEWTKGSRSREVLDWPNPQEIIKKKQQNGSEEFKSDILINLSNWPPSFQGDTKQRTTHKQTKSKPPQIHSYSYFNHLLVSPKTQPNTITNPHNPLPLLHSPIVLNIEHTGMEAKIKSKSPLFFSYTIRACGAGFLSCEGDFWVLSVKRQNYWITWNI